MHFTLAVYLFFLCSLRVNLQSPRRMASLPKSSCRAINQQEVCFYIFYTYLLSLWGSTGPENTLRRSSSKNVDFTTKSKTSYSCTVNSLFLLFYVLFVIWVEMNDKKGLWNKSWSAAHFIIKENDIFPTESNCIAYWWLRGGRGLGTIMLSQIPGYQFL